MASESIAFHDIEERDVAALHALNQKFKVELSDKTLEEFKDLVAAASWTCCAGNADGFALAFDSDSTYDNPNFDWFKRRYKKFVYLDRICVDPKSRKKGIGRNLYTQLIEYMRKNDYNIIGIEINGVPPNVMSENFHKSLGFQKVGSAEFNGGCKVVNYWVLDTNLIES
ncbi:hypothetical protein DASB73_013030 [Starmerella bacillaris]|uniref:N-acetyltransferase domain-containing protein n=1 Tax=Starmerella bacillaris TaxID=1247836 RepID=A0AAV5RFZ6_STABA|nr:hypothetical protein DASB73_013030 [Starmerella bacillaris]